MLEGMQLFVINLWYPAKILAVLYAAAYPQFIAKKCGNMEY